MVNPGKRNRHGSNTAYKLVPGAAFPAMIDKSSPVYERASVIGHTLWVTAQDDRERWPAGDYPTQSESDLTAGAEPHAQGIRRWTEDDESLVNTDVVLWYVFGIHHITRVEDWPIMPADTISFWLSRSASSTPIRRWTRRAPRAVAAPLNPLAIPTDRLLVNLRHPHHPHPNAE